MKDDKTFSGVYGLLSVIAFAGAFLNFYWGWLLIPAVLLMCTQFYVVYRFYKQKKMAHNQQVKYGAEDRGP